MRTGIFGGTFNPPHKGHILSMLAAMEQLSLEEVWVIPSGTPPHKALPAGSATEQQRLEMTLLATQGIKNVKVLDVELRKTGPSYSWETVKALREAYPEREFFFLMGGDMFLYLPHWVNVEYILKNVTVAVFARQDGEDRKISDFAAQLTEQYGCRIEMISKEPLECSSTQVREMLKRGDECCFLDEKVVRYIKTKGLYQQMQYDFEAFERYGRENLSEKRMRHVLGCAEEAVKLAERWGVDKDDAKAAALLHDVTKELDLEGQLKLCSKYGIILDNVEKTAPKLLHSKTGAAIAKHEFGVPDRVHDAIFWHTTGKADMTPLEKVLFMADYIEPTRDFEGVEPLRRAAYEDIEKSMMMGLEITAEEVRERGQELHVKSVEAMDWLLRGNKNEQ